MKQTLRVVVYFFILFLMIAASREIYAAKARVRKSTATSGSGVAYSQARLSRGTNSVILTFLNLQSVSKVAYTLSYSANGIEQGAGGSFTPTGQATDSRDLYFGTCSHGVCTPHYSIKNARLVITTYLKSGGKNIKLYRIKY